GFTGTYVAGVPRHGLAVVLLTNRQNLGRDDEGQYPNVNGLRAAVLRALVAGAEADAAAGQPEPGAAAGGGPAGAAAGGASAAAPSGSNTPVSRFLRTSFHGNQRPFIAT